MPPSRSVLCECACTSPAQSWSYNPARSSLLDMQTVAEAEANLEQLLHVKFVPYSGHLRAVTAGPDLGFVARP